MSWAPSAVDAPLTSRALPLLRFTSTYQALVLTVAAEAGVMLSAATPAPTSAVTTATAIPRRRLLRCFIPGCTPSGVSSGCDTLLALTTCTGRGATFPGRPDLQWFGRTERLLVLAKMFGSARPPEELRRGQPVDGRDDGRSAAVGGDQVEEVRFAELPHVGQGQHEREDFAGGEPVG